MKFLILYRILSYVLLPVAGFLCLMLLAVLPAALANPVLLLAVFLIANIIIYSYTSFRFLNKGILGRQYCKPMLRDLMRVNGFFSAGLAVLFLFQSITLLGNPQLADEVASQSLSNMPAEANFTKEDLYKMISFIMRFFLVYGIILLTHVVLSLYYLRQFRGIFISPDQDQHQNPE